MTPRCQSFSPDGIAPHEGPKTSFKKWRKMISLPLVELWTCICSQGRNTGDDMNVPSPIGPYFAVCKVKGRGVYALHALHCKTILIWALLTNFIGMLVRDANSKLHTWLARTERKFLLPTEMRFYLLLLEHSRFAAQQRDNDVLPVTSLSNQV